MNFCLPRVPGFRLARFVDGIQGRPSHGDILADQSLDPSAMPFNRDKAQRLIVLNSF